MRAAVLTKPATVEIIDVADPVPSDDEVLIHMAAVGICGSDLSVFEGSKRTPSLPWVVGHEGTGRIVSVGRLVDATRIGERVVIEPNYCCLSCCSCEVGRTSACVARVAVGMNSPGILAEYVCVPASFTIPVRHDIDLADLVCAEPLAVGHAAVRRSGIRPGDSCAIVGFGSAGSLLFLLLCSLGFAPRFVEPQAGRHRLARDLGAVAAVEGDEFDVVFDTSSRPGTETDPLAMVRPGGTLVLLGIGCHVMPWSSAAIVYRQASIVGSLIYDHPSDFRKTVQILADGAVRPHRVLSSRFPFDRSMEAFAQAREAPGKTWIVF